VPYIFRNTDKAAVNWKSSHETLHSRVDEIMLAKRLEQTRPGPEKRPRQRQVEGRRWTLIGEAYVHGIMHGEALLDESLKPGFIQSGLILLLTVANCSTSHRHYTSTPLFLPVVTLLVLKAHILYQITLIHRFAHLLYTPAQDRVCNEEKSTKFALPESSVRSGTRWRRAAMRAQPTLPR